MMDFVYLNDYIREFVDRKIAEKVCLDTRTSFMAIRPESRRGSTIIAMFWVKVLQHPLNFPSRKFSYHKYQDAVLGVEKLILRAEDQVFVLNLVSGALEIQGASSHAWFKRRFKDILHNYDGFSDATRSWYTAEDEAKAAAEEEAKARRDTGLVQFSLTDEDLVSEVERQHLRGLWTGRRLDAVLDALQPASVKDAASFIYPLWKSLLLRWLSDAETRAVLVASRLDAARMRDLTDLSLLRRDTAAWSAILIPNTADPPRTSKTELQARALAGYSPADALWAEYQVFARVASPPGRVRVNFVAGVRNGEVELLLYSCEPTADCFDAARVVASVQFARMTEAKFEADFLMAVAGSAEREV